MTTRGQALPLRQLLVHHVLFLSASGAWAAAPETEKTGHSYLWKITERWMTEEVAAVSHKSESGQKHHSMEVDGDSRPRGLEAWEKLSFL